MGSEASMIGLGPLLFIFGFSILPGAVLSIIIGWMALKCPSQAELDRGVADCVQLHKLSDA